MRSQLPHGSTKTSGAPRCFLARIGTKMIKISERALMLNTYASQASNAAVSSENLALYEVQKPFVVPILQARRLWNTALDALSYDVGLFSASLLAKGTVVDTEAPA